MALIHYEAMICFHLYPSGETVAGITPGKVHCIAASFFPLFWRRLEFWVFSMESFGVTAVF